MVLVLVLVVSYIVVLVDCDMTEDAIGPLHDLRFKSYQLSNI